MNAELTVEEIMSTPLETISADASVRDAARQMRDRDINGLFVPGSSAGIVTTTDVVDAVASGEDLTGMQVSDVYTAPVERVTTSVEVREAAAMMTNYGIKHLPVVDVHGDYVGMISSTDLTGQLV